MSEYDVWAADYDQWASEMTEDAPFYVDLARDAEEPIVELGAGTGRIAIPIARETGKRVIGIDNSPAMLAVGRERPRLGCGCQRLLLEVVGVHGGDLIQRFLLLSRAWNDGGSRPGPQRRRRC